MRVVVFVVRSVEEQMRVDPFDLHHDSSLLRIQPHAVSPVQLKQNEANVATRVDGFLKLGVGLSNTNRHTSAVFCLGI